VIDLNGAVDLLNKLDLPPFEMEYQLLDIQMDMELAKIKKQAAAKKAHEAAVKAAATKAEAAAAAAAKAAKITPRDLAKTDIFAAYGYDIISLAVVKILLTKAGFDDAEIAILIQTYESKAKQTKDKLEAAIAKQRSAKKAKGSS
jgi:phage protein D